MITNVLKTTVDRCFGGEKRTNLPERMTPDRVAAQTGVPVWRIRKMLFEFPSSVSWEITRDDFTTLARLMSERSRSDLALGVRTPVVLKEELLAARLGLLEGKVFDGIGDVAVALGKLPAPSRQDIAEKRSRISSYLNAQDADYLQVDGLNFQNWLMAGGCFHEIVNQSIAKILVPADRKKPVIIFINNVEKSRVEKEELFDRFGKEWGDIARLEVHPWRQTKPNTAKFTKCRIVISDTENPDVQKLHYSLTEQDLVRYRWLGSMASAALTKAAFFVKFGEDTELDLEARITRMLRQHNIFPEVLLVAADDWINKTNHPLARNVVIKNDVQMVLCARSMGYIVNLTRRVIKGHVSEDLGKNVMYCAKVFGMAIQGTNPGRTYGNIYRSIRDGLGEFGDRKAVERCHIGGPTGIGIRDELVSSADDKGMIQRRQAFTWNPIYDYRGKRVKFEDTIVSGVSGLDTPEIITLDPYGIWPMNDIWISEGNIMQLPGILER